MIFKLIPFNIIKAIGVTRLFLLGLLNMGEMEC